MKKVKLLIMAIAMIISFALPAQVSITTDGSTADASAMLDVKSSNKGFLPPRVTTSEMNSINNPADGLTVYNTDLKALCVYNGSNWDCMDAQSLFNKTFYCGDNLKDFRDGQSYSTVQIGTQCWMAENLNIGTMINGSSEQTDNDTIEKYCYNDIASNCDTYGGLYQWNEMMQYVTTAGAQGICPAGWHLPTDAEWCTLENYIDAGTVSCTAVGWRGTDAGGNLKETGTAHWNSPNTGATNSSGFTGLPGGFRLQIKTFGNFMYYAYFWSSSGGSSNATIRNLGYISAEVFRGTSNTTYGMSVRCVRD